MTKKDNAKENGDFGYPLLADVRAFAGEILKRISEDKNKLKTIKGQIHGHIRIELIIKKVLRDYENGEHFS